MKVIPANLAVAKSMAKALRSQLNIEIGLKLSLQRSYEVFAIALGYNNWHEMSKVIAGPGKGTYLSSQTVTEWNAELMRMAERLRRALELDQQSPVEQIIVFANLGHEPKYSAKWQPDGENETPWGTPCNVVELYPGITEYETGSHGGYRLSPDRVKKMKAVLGIDWQWYEEDCEVGLVQGVFQDEFGPMAGIDRVRDFYPAHMKTLYGIGVDEYAEYTHKKALGRFRAEPDTWFAIQSLGHITEMPSITFGYFAMTGRDALAWYESHDASAPSRGSYFVVDLFAGGGVALGDPLPSHSVAAPEGIENKPLVPFLNDESAPRHSLQEFITRSPRFTN